jgi:hypothetical protein
MAEGTGQLRYLFPYEYLLRTELKLLGQAIFVLMRQTAFACPRLLGATILFAVMEPEDAGASRKSTSLELPAAAIFSETRGLIEPISTIRDPG